MKSLYALGRSGSLAAAVALAAVIASGPQVGWAQCTGEELCVCTGDCDRDGEVFIVELQSCSNGFLGDPFCLACNRNLDDEVDIVELQGAVNGFLDASTCPVADLARFDIGFTAGAPGATVNVPISLKTLIDDVVTVAPLRFDFDAARLNFVGCDSVVADKSAVAESPASGMVSVVLYADPFAQPPQSLEPIPQGPVLNCSFGIKPGAAAGPAPLTFAAAGLADSSFNDFTAIGSNGSVTIQ